MLKLSLQKLFTFKILISIILAAFIILSSITFILTSRLELFWLLFCISIIESLNYFENKYKINQLYCSLPIKRESIVLANFLSGYIILIILIGLSFLVAVFMKLIFPIDLFVNNDMAILENFMYFILLYSIYISVTFTIYFKYGYITYPSGILLNVSVSLLISMLFLSILYIFNSINSGIWAMEQFQNSRGLIIGFIIGVLKRSEMILGKQNLYIIFCVFIIFILVVSIKLSIVFFKKKIN